MGASLNLDRFDHTKELTWVPSWPFYFGLMAVFLVLWLPLLPTVNTFIHPWRGEIASSIFIAITLIYLWFRSDAIQLRLRLNRLETNFIIYPIILFVFWSLLSIAWASSWKSVIHHTCIWVQYLVIYLIFRYLLESRHNLGKFINLFFAIFGFLAIQALILFVANYVFGGANFSGMIFQRYGEQVSAILPLMLVVVLRMKHKYFLLGTLGIASMWALVLLGLGRINLIACVSGFILTIVMSHFCTRRRRPEFRKRVGIVTAAFILTTLCVAVVPTALNDKMVTGVNRFSRDRDTENSNDVRRLLASLSFEMIKSHPIVGVGADNWGFQANNFRLTYGSEHLDDQHLIQAEDGILERAHNEYLQIAAELGIVGIFLFGGLLFGIGYMTVRLYFQKKCSPFRIAALLGVYLFLASSLVSSYSYRVLQNGIVFFFLLAICSRYFFRDAGPREKSIVVSGRRLKFIFGLGIFSCLVLSAYSAVRLLSMSMTVKANSIQEISEAKEMYDKALDLDNENPDSRTFLARRYLEEKRFSDAVPLFQEAIRIGSSRSTEYSYLATTQKHSHDPIAAENTMEVASRMYPYSVFVLTRYAAILRENGNTRQSDAILERARSIDLKSTNTWWVFINEGAGKASKLAFEDKNNYTEVMNLKPQRSIYAVIDERKITHPEEALKMDF